MANFAFSNNVAVSQRFKVHKIIAHFSPILDKKFLVLPEFPSF